MSGNVAPVVFLVVLNAFLTFGAYSAGKMRGYEDGVKWGVFNGYFRGYDCGYEKGRRDAVWERDAE